MVVVLDCFLLVNYLEEEINCEYYWVYGCFLVFLNEELLVVWRSLYEKCFQGMYCKCYILVEKWLLDGKDGVKSEDGLFFNKVVFDFMVVYFECVLNLGKLNKDRGW